MGNWVIARRQNTLTVRGYVILSPIMQFNAVYSQGGCVLKWSGLAGLPGILAAWQHRFIGDGSL